MERYSRSTQGITALLTAFGADIDRKHGTFSEVRGYISGNGLRTMRLEELERRMQQGDVTEKELKSLLSTLQLSGSADGHGNGSRNREQGRNETRSVGSMEYRKHLIVHAAMQFLKRLNEQVKGE
jgi:CO/xanthine dehydrogenase FAD-binding subunit